MMNIFSKTSALALFVSTLVAGPVLATLGDPVSGLTAEESALFAEGQLLFEKDFTPNEGLGPLYNATSCVACHGGGATGGWDPDGVTNNVTHFGITYENRFYEAHESGGPVKQAKSVAGHPQRPNCTMDPETPESVAQWIPGMIFSSRQTPGVFGFGLLDAVSDKKILKYSGKKRWKAPGVIGVANWGVEMEGVSRALAFSLDQAPSPGVPLWLESVRTQVTGARRVGRFGWKSQTATLFQFSAEPFAIELGISSPFFERENAPGLAPIPEECASSAGPDDVDSSQSLRLFYFQALLAPPERGDVGFRERVGEIVFGAVGCTDCHRRKMKTSNRYFAPDADGNATRVHALENKVFYPYSDLLLHDMGEENSDYRPMGGASGRFWRTTPLWGLGQRTNFWHDGSITDLESTIAAHEGEGSWSAQAYDRLPGFLKRWVLKFMESL
ncbi:MAG: hypothetical protein GY822_22230 [Deltaproteobacteria bacterium]|nr:hypothetical protein [Deltaproteobacteria bacterium]